MTRMQEMSLDYHFTVEQEVGSSTYAFFGFNGKPCVTVVELLPINVTESFFEFKLIKLHKSETSCVMLYRNGRCMEN